MADFHRTLTVTSTETVTLDVDVAVGELQVFTAETEKYRSPHLSEAQNQLASPTVSFLRVLSIEQSGNHIKIRASAPAAPEERISVLYRIDVPYRTELTSKIDSGKQVITGILGPVNAVTNNR